MIRGDTLHSLRGEHGYVPGSGLRWEHTEGLTLLCGCGFPPAWDSGRGRAAPFLAAECLQSRSSLRAYAALSCTSPGGQTEPGATQSGKAGMGQGTLRKVFPSSI